MSNQPSQQQDHSTSNLWGNDMIKLTNSQKPKSPFSLQMKNGPSPLNFPSPSNQRRQNLNLQHGYTNKHNHTTHSSVLDYVKGAAKRVSGVFTKLFRRRKQNHPEEILVPDFSRNTAPIRGTSYFSSESSLKSSSTYASSTSRCSSVVSNGQVGNFSLEEIFKATENFSPANKIGEGAFGTVYKGRLKDGRLVAIKRMKQNKYDKRLSLEFKNEILTLSMIEHLNLVRLYGYLEHGDEQMILVEYISNGTLREHLDGKLGNGLEMAERLEIAIDIAHAITYLHMYTDHPIIHRDIKASNILITEKLRAKVADFGFARLAANDPDASHISTQIKGTVGYLDPDYLRTNQLTDKSDVYSFGVLLVEMMTGRQPIESRRPTLERVTIRWAIQKLKDGEVVLAMDPRLNRCPASNMAVEKVLKLAQTCLAPLRKSRPSMKKCAEELWEIRKDFKERFVPPPPSPLISHRSAKFPERDAQGSFSIEDGEYIKFDSA
ncbi:calmodulin-binding receptor-like cytoplasmic kinase 2 [Quercus suber]|uniref:calmodulin-binding receptor-like cytoplasmic kinase 2 n=1 Tax=Quercus suber TaxID=58331 RepID=UPI0032DEB701